MFHGLSWQIFRQGERFTKKLVMAWKPLYAERSVFCVTRSDNKQEWDLCFTFNGFGCPGIQRPFISSIASNASDVLLNLMYTIPANAMHIFKVQTQSVKS